MNAGDAGMGLTPKKRKVVLVLAVTFLLFLGYSIFEEKGFVRLYGMKVERDRLQERIQTLKDENERLAEEIRLLGDDPGTLEALGRVELGLVKPGETIYILPETPGGSP